MVTFRHTVDLTWRRVCRPTRKTYVVPTATTQQCRGVTMNTCVTDCRYFRRHCSLFSRTGAGFSQVSVESSCRQYLIGSLIRTFLNTYLTTCQRYWCILCRCEHDNVYNLLYLNNWISLKLCHEIPVWEAFMILIRRDMAFYVLRDLIPCPDSSAIKRTVAWFIFNNNHFTSLHLVNTDYCWPLVTQGCVVYGDRVAVARPVSPIGRPLLGEGAHPYL